MKSSPICRFWQKFIFLPKHLNSKVTKNTPFLLFNLCFHLDKEYWKAHHHQFHWQHSHARFEQHFGPLFLSSSRPNCSSDEHCEGIGRKEWLPQSRSFLLCRRFCKNWWNQESSSIEDSSEVEGDFWQESRVVCFPASFDFCEGFQQHEWILDPWQFPRRAFCSALGKALLNELLWAEGGHSFTFGRDWQLRSQLAAKDFFASCASPATILPPIDFFPDSGCGSTKPCGYRKMIL